MQQQPTSPLHKGTTQRTISLHFWQYLGGPNNWGHVSRVINHEFSSWAPKTVLGSLKTPIEIPCYSLIVCLFVSIGLLINVLRAGGCLQSSGAGLRICYSKDRSSELGSPANVSNEEGH